VSDKNPHEPGTLEATAWKLRESIRREKAKRKQKTKGAFGKPKGVRS